MRIIEIFGLPKIYALKWFLCFASLILICVSLVTQVQAAGKEPIAYIGHGAMFDQNGREVAPTIEFIREAQAWYRNYLLEKLTKDERVQFDKIENRLTEGLALDEQSRLVLDAHLLEWLINTAKIEDRERILGKNNLMKLKLGGKLQPKGSPTRSLEPFQVPQELLDRLQAEELARTGRPPAVLFPTTAGGQAYRNLCLANGVPVPPDWGTSGWVSRGQIPQTEVFISASLQAEVFTYQSASPEGMCIALPRFNTANTIQLLGVICLGKVTSKACFWDNQNGGTQFFPQVGQVVPFSQFGGGNDLDANIGGICTDCHAGENPYIIHPATVLGTLQSLGLPTFSDNWYEPIVKPGWPQNPGPMPSPGACGGCHTAGGQGRPFPHLSTDLPGYCGTILPLAISQTMPPGSPSSLAGDSHPAKLNALCGVAPGGSAATRGDPHITTVDGVNYDFQSAGEFVALRSADGLEIQTRQTPVATTSTVGPNPHTGLTTCVSLNTAVAARVGTHRVTFQPNVSSVPDPSGLQLRVDGVLTTLGAQGLNLGPGARVMKSAVGDGIEIDFPNGIHLIVTAGWWGAPHNKWYLNLDVLNFSARQGIMGNIAPGSWLPALPNGTSLGARPATLRQRYVDLYQKFADAWRVNARTSLFDYAPRTSTATFTLRSWPPENPPCVIRGTTAAKPMDRRRAQQLCRPILDKNMNADCVFDVRVTGEAGFAKTYLLTQQLRAGSTTTFVNDDQDPTQVGAPVTFTATVARTAAGGKGYPGGTVQFTLDGSRVGAPVKLDSKGMATWRTSSLKVGTRQVAARYIPSRNSVFLASSSIDEPHTVKWEDCAKTVLVSGIHVPDKTCAQSSAAFRAGLLTNFHFTSKCPPDAPLRSVLDVACQDAPIPGFSTGSVYQGTACCGKRRLP